MKSTLRCSYRNPLAALFVSTFAFSISMAALPVSAQSLAGLGASAQSTAAGLSTANTVVVPLGRHSRFVVEQTTWTPPQALVDPVAQPRAALALEFRSPRRNEAARDLLRIKLSGDGVLNFRPRGGGLKVFYEAQF